LPFEKLPKPNIDQTRITVSGVSSGAAMAVQLAVSNAKFFSAVGSTAGSQKILLKRSSLHSFSSSIPFTFNLATRGGLIRLLCGVTREEAVLKGKEVYIVVNRQHPLYRIRENSELRAENNQYQNTLPEDFRWVVQDAPPVGKQ
jgi:hypothetical protein